MRASFYFALIAMCCYKCLNAQQHRPNFVFILLDDQDILLKSPTYMEYLQTLIVDQGATLSNGFVSTPVCCPSRTETMTGRYFHNIGAPSGECMHINAEANIFSNTTIFQTLYQSGQYETGVFGKLTNNDGKYFCQQNRSVEEAGMSRVYSMCNQGNFYCPKYRSKYINGTDYFTNLNVNSKSTYQSYQIGNESLKFIENVIVNYSQKSFFSYTGFHCPHIPYTPPPWAETLITDGWIGKLKAPIGDNYNYKVTQQQPWLEQQPKLLNYTINWMDKIYQDRIASTLQVDIYIKQVIDLLTKYNQLNNTYIIYTSDHGYHLGQYRIPCEKEQIFDTDIRVPYYIRGPHIKAKTTINNIASNVDIYPTVLDFAGIDIPTNVDGKSLKSVLLGYENNNTSIEWRDMLLVELMAVDNAYWSNCNTWVPSSNGDFHGQYIKPNATQNTGENDESLRIYYGDGINYGNTWRLLRIINETYDWTYAEYYDYHFNATSFKNPYVHVLYDNMNDAYQLHNVYDNISTSIQTELHQMLMQYGACKGDQCP